MKLIAISLLTLWLALDAAAAPLKGHVVDTDGKPLAGAFVSLLAQTAYNQTLMISSSVCDANGEYALEVPDPRPNIQTFAVSYLPSVGISRPIHVGGTKHLNLQLQGGFDLQVTFVDMAGAPIPNLTAHLSEVLEPGLQNQDTPPIDFSDEASRLYTLTTDEKGICVIHNLPSGSIVRIAVDDQHYCKLPGVRVDHRFADQTTIHLSAPCTLNGSAIMADGGRPVARAPIAIFNKSNGVSARLVADDSGQFMFSRLPAGSYLVMLDEGASFNLVTAPLHFDLVSGQTASIKLPLEPGAIITGKIRDSAADKGIPGITVFSSSPESANAVTDAAGNYTLRVLPGDVKIRVASPLLGPYLSSPSAQSNPPGARVAEGQTAAINFDLNPNPIAACHGVVIRTDGTPAAGAVVNYSSEIGERVRSADGKPMGTLTPMGMAQTDDQGRFTLYARTPLIARATLGGLLTPSPTRVKEPTDNLRLTVLDPSDQGIRITVTDPDGKPIPGATVSAGNPMDGVGGGVPPVRTEADGVAFVFGAANDQPCPVIVRASGFAWTHQTIAAGKTRASIVLQRANSTVEGFVVDDLGTPAAHIKVNLASMSGGQQTETDQNGRFIFDVPAGMTGAVRIALPGNRPPLNQARVQAGDNNVKLVMPEPATKP